MTIISGLAVKIRRQDWFAVVLEVFVVVLGILIGLQVTSWNEDRKQQRAAYFEAVLTAFMLASNVWEYRRRVLAR
jgi:hypothetical protein